MKSWYFHQEKGQTVGPITLVEIKKRVREGRIRIFDLVYREGEPGWRMALEHPELRDDFKPSTVHTMVDRPWVCLKRKSEEGFEFATTGPFSTEDIRLHLQEGLISYSDYVWRDGYGEWKRIGSLEEFNRRLARERERRARRDGEKAAAPPPEWPAKELLQNVVEMKRPQAPAVPAPRPAEATTEDLVAEGVSPLPLPPAPKVATKSSQPSAVKRTSRRKKSSVWMDWAVVIGLAATLSAVVLLVVKYIPLGPERPPVEEIVASPPKEISTPKANPAPPTPLPEPPPEIPPANVGNLDKVKPIVKSAPPTELILEAKTLGSNQVKIELRTDARGEEYPVYLQIVGLPGQVSDGASYYKFIKLSSRGSRKDPLDLSGVSLPQGKFILRAEVGDLKKEVKMNVGTAESSYRQTVARLRKTYAHMIWKERLALMRLIPLLEKQVTEAVEGKKFSGKGLESVEKVKRTNGSNYVLFDQWYEMKDILSQAKSAPSAALLGRVKLLRERLATFSVWK